MLKKNEVLKALENGGYILVDTISRTALVMAEPGERIDSCRYDTAENIERSDGYIRRETDWFAVYHIEVDPPAEEAREDMTLEEIEKNVARIVRGVIGKEKAAKMMASNEQRQGGLLVYLCHGGCCLGDAQTIQEELLAAGYFIPEQMGNAVIYVTATDPDAAQEEAQEEAEFAAFMDAASDAWDAESERVRAAVAADLPGLVDEEEEEAAPEYLDEHWPNSNEQPGIWYSIEYHYPDGSGPYYFQARTVDDLESKVAQLLQMGRSVVCGWRHDRTTRERRRFIAETRQERTERANRDTCRRIAEELEAYCSGSAYKCPHCGEVHEMWEYENLERTDEDGEIFYHCPDCDQEIEEDDLEAVGVWDYFEDCLDIEYRCNAHREYRSVCVMVTCGGPNIYIDTDSKAVELYWWTERASYTLSADAVEAVDAWAAEYWEVI